MEKITDSLSFSLAHDCVMLKLSEDVIIHCLPFSCGDTDLDEFFSHDAIAYEKDLMGKTYCWVLKENDSQIVGMITLANASIQTTHLQNHPRRKINAHIANNKRGRTYPAVLVGRLGVDTKFQGKQFRVGEQIMNFIKTWFDGTDNKTGCRFVLVDAVNNDRAISYYERNGFKPLFPRIEDEKQFYGIEENEILHTRMYYFDLI